MNEYMQATWDRLGGDEFDRLAARLAETDEEFARLDARYGRGGTWDAQRKAFRSAYAVEIRAEARESGEKLTEPMVEERSASHPDVLAWLRASEGDMRAYAVLASERETIRERMRYLRAVCYASGGEARLG